MGTTYGAFGSDVRTIQDRLDAASATRLPRLHGDSQFGPLTMGRVMEFQFQEGLSTDGDVGPATASRLAERSGNNDPPSGRCILVDLINDRLRAFDNGLTKSIKARPQYLLTDAFTSNLARQSGYSIGLAGSTSW